MLFSQSHRRRKGKNPSTCNGCMTSIHDDPLVNYYSVVLPLSYTRLVEAKATKT